MADTSKFLNYGDCIYIHSADLPKAYLSARSILEEKVFFIKTPLPNSADSIEEVDSTFYENQSELLFALYPKLNYQAYKNYTKLKPNDDPFKVELMKKRLDVELDQNQKLIEKTMSTPVTFGSEVQLLHVSSNSFIRGTREKNAIKNELYELRLSKKGGSGMYFKIIPYLTFKKEGEKISLKDFFYLENSKLQAAIVYKNIPEFLPAKDKPTDNDSEEENQVDHVSPQKLQRNYMPIMELSSTFERFEAGLKQQDLNSPLAVRLILTQKQNYSSKTLLWGNYVRLKFMLTTKQTGYFYCDPTIIGGNPNVYCRIINANNPYEKESLQAIFQIVPISEDLYGTPILFEDSKEIFIRLRHVLTGRYLTIGSEQLKCCLSEPLDAFLEQTKPQKGEESPKRSEKKGENIEFNNRRRRNSQIRRERSSYLQKSFSQSKLKIVNLQNGNSQSSLRLLKQNKPSQLSDKKLENPQLQKGESHNLPSPQLKANSNSNLLQEHIIDKDIIEGLLDLNPKDDESNLVSKFFEKTSIKLRNVSQDDEGILTSDSVFSLESIQFDPSGLNGCLTVKQNDKDDIMNQEEFRWMREAAYDDENTREYFESRFHRRNPLDKEEFEALISFQNDIYFHFAIVGMNEISEIMAIQSRIYPLIKLTDEIGQRPKNMSPKGRPEVKRYTHKINEYGFLQPKGGEDGDDELPHERKTKNLAEALDSVRKLSLWLSTDDQNYNTGNLSRQIKQKIMREIGVIDILFDLLIQLFTRSLLKVNTKALVQYKSLTQEIFELLQTVIHKNRANNIYVFQWSKLLQGMTLRKSIASDLGVDKLLSQIFYENVIEINELNEIPAHLGFEDYDLKALNIAIALYRHNPIRSTEEKERIISTLILDEKNRNKIFRKFEQDEQGNIIVYALDGTKLPKIDQSLEYKDKKMFDFSMGILNLATEITRSQPQVVYNHLNTVYPIELCTSIFENRNRKWNYLFRSAFLDLFTEMYLSVESVDLPDLQFPSNIKPLNKVKIPSEASELFESRKRKVLQHFINEQFNLKKFVWDFLSDPHKWADDEHKYIHSVLKLIHLICVKGLYEWEELSRLKQCLYNYLKFGLATVHAEIIPEAKYYEVKNHSKPIEKKVPTKKKTRKESVVVTEKSEREKLYELAEEDDGENEEDDFVEDTNDKGDPYWKKIQTKEMVTWMVEALKIIEFIEHYELNNTLKDFFDNEETLKFFNEKLMSRSDSTTNTLASDLIAQIKQDKEAYALNYTNNNFVLQNYKNTLLLMELLLIKSPVLSSQIVQLLYLNFSKHKDFLNSLNAVEVIHPENLETYSFYLKTYDSLRLSKVRLDSLYGQEALISGAKIYLQVDKTLSDLLFDFHNNDRPLNNGETVDSKNVYIIHEHYTFEPNKGREKQNLLRSLSFFEVVTQLFIPLSKGKYCKTHDLRERYLLNYLHFYAYLCVNNPTNQQLMTNNQEFIQALLSIEFPKLQPLLLRVVSEMYKDNFSLLIHTSQQNQNIITLLMNKFFARFTSEELTRDEFFIMCLRVFPTFFQIKNNFLTQNQVYFAKSFYAKVLEKPEQYNINNILTMRLYRFLSTNKLDDHVLKSDPLTIKVPPEISFAIYFLNTFSMMVAGSNASNSLACLTNKYYLSIKDIYVLIKVAGDWFNLKLALVTFLNHVYIKNKKLEDNEITELYNIVRECMFEELNEYNRFLRNRHLYPRSPHQKFSLSFPTYYPIVTEFNYREVIDEVYHQYILHGVMDTFQFYAQRLKTNPSENDHAILDDYVSSSLAELKEFWHPNPNQKRNFQLDMEMIPMKNKMIIPIEEPSDPDILDGDMLVPQLNERKKANQLKKDILKITNLIRKKERVKALKVFPTDFINWQPNKSIREQLALDLRMIETRHNMELEILVKFLLDVKLENPKKFQIIIQCFMNVLGDEDTVNYIKQAALTVIRKLSNFKNNPAIYETIQTDLVQLKFIDFFDDVIVNTKNEEDRLEFLLAMIDFLDDASLKIQEELFASLYKDEDNLYLETIKRFMISNFEDFRENEKNFTDGNSDDQYNAKSVVYKKMYRIIYSLEMLRLSCENHFEPMQNYLREQIQANGRNKKSINFINVITDIFSRYTKSVNEKNAMLGIKLLDTLIEMMQGPCQENQIALCNAKILENLEDLIVEINEIRKKKESLVWSEMNNKILTLILALLEGSQNSYIIEQVSIHINVSFFLERMEEIYNQVYKQRKKGIFKKPQKKDSRGNSKPQALVMSLVVLESELLNQEGYKCPQGEYKAYINEGVQFGILLYSLSNLSGDIAIKIENFKAKIKEENIERYKELQRAEAFYSKHIGQIEIINKKGDLQRIYFPIIDKIKYLSSVTKEKFLDEVNRESANEKLFGLVRHSELFEDEMNHFLRLKKKGLKFSLTYFSRLRDLNLLIAFATNIIILFEKHIAESFADLSSYPLATPDEQEQLLADGQDEANRLIRILGIVHIVLCFVVLLFWVFFQAPLDINSSFREFDSKKEREESSKDNNREKNKLKLIYDQIEHQLAKISYMLFDTYLVYLVLFLLFAILGTTYSKVFFGFLLFDLIDRSVILNNVIQAVTVNYKQLLMTAVLGILIMYVYAVLGFFVVLDGELAEENCDSVFHCFLFMTDNALRQGGGVGEALGEVPLSDQENYNKRYFFDLFYFLIIIIMLLNIIFGIIIDTFADLRDQKTLKGSFILYYQFKTFRF